MRTLVYIIVLVFILSTLSFAQPVHPSQRSSAFGLKIGLVEGTPIKVKPKPGQGISGTYTLESDGSYCVGVFFEQGIYRKLRMQLGADIFDLKKDLGIVDKSESLLQLSLGPKLHIMNKRKTVAFRPAMALGYGRLTRVFDLDETDYMILNAFGEFVLFSKFQAGLILEVGAFWTLSGGNDQADVSASHVGFFRVGLLL